MKNAIIYSVHSVEEKFEESSRFRQLLYSVSRLRRFNKDIDVYAYVSDKYFFENTSKYKSLNIIFKYFETPNYEVPNIDYKNSNNAERLWHRWTNAFETLKTLDYDNVLYIDTDTIFYNDPEVLFSTYGNTDYLHTREDNCYEIMKILGVDNNGINAGQILFSKNLKYTEKDMFGFMKQYIDYKLVEVKNRVSEEVYNQILWVIDQYAIYEYYKSIGTRINMYDKKHVMLHLEPWINPTSELVLHHYLNGNYKVAVPAEFRDDDISERFL
jgi:hypothetical protein